MLYLKLVAYENIWLICKSDDDIREWIKQLVEAECPNFKLFSQ